MPTGSCIVARGTFTSVLASGPVETNDAGRVLSADPVGVVQPVFLRRRTRDSRHQSARPSRSTVCRAAADPRTTRQP